MGTIFGGNLINNHLVKISITYFSLIFGPIAFGHGGAIEIDILSGQPTRAGASETLELGVYTDEGLPIHAFSKFNGHYMQLFAISANRDVFTQLFPTWLGAQGSKTNQFEVDINSKTSSFDNFQSENAFPFAAEYYLYAFAKKKGISRARKAEYNFEILKGKVTSVVIANDTINSSGVITKYFRRGPTGTHNFTKGTQANYDIKATLRLAVKKVRSKRQLTFRIDLYENLAGRVVKIKNTNILNWPATQGQLVLVSENHEEFFKTDYPFSLKLLPKNLNQLKQKNISIWAQFRLKDSSGAEDPRRASLRSRVLTIPFQFDLAKAL